MPDDKAPEKYNWESPEDVQVITTGEKDKTLPKPLKFEDEPEEVEASEAPAVTKTVHIYED